jgi:selenocysteine lyase/cysteine desulfurase
MRDRFLLASGFTNFNHGSFGSVPKEVNEAQRSYSLQCEARPDKWFRQDYFVCVDTARSMLAKYINAPSSDAVVMVENASGAVNAIMRSMNWDAGGVILYLSSAYAMVKNTALWLAQTKAKVENIEVKLGTDFPMAGDDSVLTPLREALVKYKGKIRLLIISHITSCPAVTLPVEQILELARSEDASGGGSGAVPVLVDGAHALGQIDIDLQAMGDPDFYVSNGMCGKGDAARRRES